MGHLQRARTRRRRTKPDAVLIASVPTMNVYDIILESPSLPFKEGEISRFSGFPFAAACGA
jgi:hypothetical protein